MARGKGKNTRIFNKVVTGGQKDRMQTVANANAEVFITTTRSGKKGAWRVQAFSVAGSQPNKVQEILQTLNGIAEES